MKRADIRAGEGRHGDAGVSAEQAACGSVRAGERTILLIVEYDGTGLVGYQKQAGGESVQSLLEKAGEALTGEKPALTASGRTDAGVHAQGLIVRAVFARLNVPVERLPAALSAHLPEGIAVVDAFSVPVDFHPRKHCIRKVYRYRLLERSIRAPLERKRAWHIGHGLDLYAMRRAARFLVGRHDFAAFATEAATKEDTVRNVFVLRIRRLGDALEIDTEGDGFLYNMVRAIAGSLVEVGRGRFPPEWIKEVLESRDRGRAGPTAPPHGLTLIRVVAVPPILLSEQGTATRERRGLGTGS